MAPRTRTVVTYVFLFIILVTAMAAVAANLGLFGLDPTSNFAKTTLAGVLVEIAGAVIYVWRTSALGPGNVSAVIHFEDEDEPENINWDLEACTYQVRDMQAEVKSNGKLNIVWEHAGWECKFPSPEKLDESVTLTLTDKQGRVWEVRPFYPLSREVNAVKRES